MHLQLLNNGSHALAKYFSIVSFEKNGSYTIFLCLDIANLLHRTFTISVDLILSFIVALKLNRMHCFSNSLGNIHMNIGVCQYSCRIFIFHLSKSRTSLWSVGLVIQ